MTKHGTRNRALRLLAGLALLGGLSAIAAPVHAQATTYTFTVNTTNDTHDVGPGDGICNDPAGNCSLRAATEEASSTTYPVGTTFTINVPAGTYRLTLGDLVLDNNQITVNGAGAGSTIIDGNAGNVNGMPPATPAANGSRLFCIGYANNGGIGILQNLTLTDGNGTSGANTTSYCSPFYRTGEGGAVYSDNNLTLINDVVTNNVATYEGGGVYQNGNNLVIQATVVSHNSVIDPNGRAYGGGLADNGDDTAVRSSSFVNNLAQGSTYAYGGGVYANSDSATYSYVQIKNNTAEATGTTSGYTVEGGGLWNDEDSMHLVAATITGNQALNMHPNGYSEGGGIYNDYVLAIDAGSTISNNTASAARYTAGGGVYNSDYLSMGNPTGGFVTLSQNLATTTFNSATSSGTTYCGSRIAGTPSNTTYTALIVNACAQGGGLYNSDYAALHNVTFSFNRAIASVCPTLPCAAGTTYSAASLGGGIFNDEDFSGQGVNITSNSVSTTTLPATANTTYGFGLGGGVYNYDENLILQNSYVQYNTAPLDGGGIYDESSTNGYVTLSSTSVTQNTAGGNGGGVYNIYPIQRTNSPIYYNTGHPCPNTVTPCT